MFIATYSLQVPIEYFFNILYSREETLISSKYYTQIMLCLYWIFFPPKEIQKRRAFAIMTITKTQISKLF